MADLVYNAFKIEAIKGRLLPLASSLWTTTGDIYIMLVTSGYTPDKDAHKTRADVTNEVTSANYTAGGQILANFTGTEDDTDDEGVFDADDPVWTPVTLTARGAVVYQKNGGASSGDPLIGYIDFGADKTATAGTFTVEINAEGILNLN